ncbi:MAG: PrsW family intramembrane metalloprotease [Treponema sp.]|jgi:RsiW-degrading membrane proteinase PrsW (M82 family)|nr:PrsW family intramembrane metalloprotease [Treponema sp.]
MSGIWVLLLLIFISAVPALAAFIWFKVSRYPLSPFWFVSFLACGAAALLLAALLQSFFPAGAGSAGALVFKTFVQIALTEETGRFLALFIIFHLFRPLEKLPELLQPSFAAAAGLLTGLGFAVVETAFYSAMDMNLALLRAFTAAPLHGACGARIGLSIFSLRLNFFKGILRFGTAAAIHGMYNFMIITPGLPTLLPALIAFSALASAVITIHSGNRASEHTNKNGDLPI